MTAAAMTRRGTRLSRFRRRRRPDGTTAKTDPDTSAPFTSPGGSSYVNLRAYQGGTAARRDLSQYNDFARKAIEKREREQREGK